MILIFAAHCSKKSYKMTLGLIEGHAVPYPTDEPWAGLEWPHWVVGSCEVSVGHRQCWQMGCMERWHRRHSLPPGKLASSPPSGPNTDCIRQQGIHVRFPKTEFKQKLRSCQVKLRLRLRVAKAFFWCTTDILLVVDILHWTNITAYAEFQQYECTTAVIIDKRLPLGEKYSNYFVFSPVIRWQENETWPLFCFRIL